MLSGAVLALFSIIQIKVIYPRFINETVNNSTDEAIRLGRHINGMLRPLSPLSQPSITDELRAEMEILQEDFGLWKVKIFSPQGEVLYSTDPQDQGTINRRQYFLEEVAKGRVVSKAVWQKEITLEEQLTPRDVVETYVPFMENERFLGACEIYYDITGRKASIDRLIFHVTLLTLALGCILLAVIGLASLRTERAMKKQDLLHEQLIRSDRLAAIGTLVSGMAHEFNNINSTVMGFSALALDDPDLGSLTRNHIERINRAARRARSISLNLLDFARQDRSPHEHGNLADAAREALDLVRQSYEKEGIIFKEGIGPLPDSPMDKDQMVQVLLNLFANARHAMLDSQRKEIAIETGRENGTISARVSDTGCGIKKEQLSKIFTPFFTLKGEHAENDVQATVKGTGLGLSVCHALVTSNGGRIEVESAEGKGSTFTVVLPVAEEKEPSGGAEDTGGGDGI